MTAPRKKAAKKRSVTVYVWMEWQSGPFKAPLLEWAMTRKEAVRATGYARKYYGTECGPITRVEVPL